MRRLFLLIAILAAMTAAGPAMADPAGTAFTFQGYLEKDGLPYSGTADLEFRAYDALVGGTPQGGVLSLTGQTVESGLFTVSLDFGAIFDGSARWLEVAVQTPGDVGFTTLDARVELQPTPYAISAPGGSFALPYAGSVDATGSTSGTDPLTGAAAARVENSAATGLSHGLVGLTSSTWQNATGVLGVGAGAGGFTSGVQGYATASPLGTGIVGIGSANGGYFRGEAAGSDGVEGATDSGSGVHGTANTGTAVFGESATGTGVRGSSGIGWGVYGTSQGGNGTGVFGQTWGYDGVGVLGRCESLTGGNGVFGYASSGGVGVLAVSEGGDGLSGRSNAGGHSGVFGYAGASGGYGGFFTGVSGSTALRADGLAQVKTLQILGADLAEAFPVVEASLEPGTVLMLAGGADGRLRTCDEAYSRRVAGVVSGANGLDAAVVLSGHSWDTSGHATVALSGRVWVRCDASAGAIHPGDLLTTAERPGHAMRADDRERAYGAILGKAMTGLEAGTGLVLVLVNLQ